MAFLTNKRCAWACVCLSFVCCFIPGCSGDVPDDVVYTELHKTVQIGRRVVLRCEFYRTPLAVYWKKGYNPRSAPSLITWFGAQPQIVTGSCVEDRSCEMDDAFSLIIKNISLADEGRYICRVSNHQGVLIYNFTDVEVFALPEDPVINECMDKNYRERCYVPLPSIDITTVNITCTVHRYFPTIDLSFLHDSRMYNTTETLEVTNRDGTKNKSISTVALPSEKPYVCVASNIPGSHYKRTTTVRVIHPDDVSTLGSGAGSSYPTTSSGLEVPLESNVIKIVVPIFVVLLIMIVAVVLYMLYKKKHHHRPTFATEKHTGEDQPLITMRNKRPLSFYEIWLIVGKSYANSVNTRKLCHTFRELNILNITPGSHTTQQEIYQCLCEWKDDIHRDNQREIFARALKSADYTEALMDHHGSSGYPSVSKNIFEHILREIGNLNRINLFLRELIPERAALEMTSNVKDAITVALIASEEWRNDNHAVHPFILLSVALERADCNPVDRNFFVVPDELLSCIEPEQELKFANKLSGRHCTRLATALPLNTNDISDIISNNNSLLFDTKLMITEWVRDEECSNFKKRCRLDDAILKIGRYDLLDFFGKVERHHTGSLLENRHPLNQYESIFDDDVPQLLKLIGYLPQNKKIQLCDTIEFKFNMKGAKNDQDKFKATLIKWRNKIMDNGQTFESLEAMEALRKVITSSKYHEMVVADEEIENVARYVLAAGKQQELTRILQLKTGIRSFENQLKDWRNVQQDHNSCRHILRKAIGNLGLDECIANRISRRDMYQIELARVAFDLLMEDVRPIIEALGMKRSRVRKYFQPMPKLKSEGTVGLVLELMKETKRYREDFCKSALRDKGFIDVARSVYLDYVPSLSELFNIVSSIDEDKMAPLLNQLDFTEDDKTKYICENEQMGRLYVMRLWKHQIRPVPYHYRLKLAFALQASDLEELANDVLSGHFRKGTPNPVVLYSILSRYDDDMIGSLCNLLKIGGSTDRATLVTLIIDWVIKWVNDVHAKEKRRLEKNNLLFNNGFGELAEEIAALELCLPLLDQ